MVHGAHGDALREELALQVLQVVSDRCQLIVSLHRMVKVGAHLTELSQQALLRQFALELSFSLAFCLLSGGHGLPGQLAEQRALQEELVDLVEGLRLGKALLSRFDNWLRYLLVAQFCCMIY